MAITEKLIITAATTQAQQALKGLNKSLAGTFAAAQIGAQAATKAMAILTAAIGDALDNATAYFKSTEQLRAALKGQNIDVAAGTTLLDAQSSALQKLTGTSDDVIRSLQAQGVAMGLSLREVDDFTRAAFRLSNVTGQDVTGAFRQIIKTLSGLSGELGEANPKIAALTNAQRKAGEAARVLNEEYADFLDINTRGLPGELVKLSNAFDGLTEAIIVRGTPESGQTVIGVIADDLKDLTLLVQQGTIVDALLQLADVAVAPLFMGVRALGFEDPLQQLIRERTEALRAQTKAAEEAARKTLAGAGGGARGGGGRVGIGDVQLGQAPGVEFGEVELGQAQLLSESQPAQFLSLQQRIADGRAAIAESNAVRMADIAMRETDAVRAVYEEQGQMMLAEQQQRNQLFARGTQQIASITASFITGALETLLEGGDFSEFVKGFLQATGQQLIASGIQSLLTAAAYTFNPAFLPLAPGLAAAGTAQIAAGTAMMAGQLLIPASAKSGGGAPASAPSFGGGGVPTTGGGGGGEGRNITIVFNGPTTKPEVGLAIREALAEAEAVGV